MFDYLATAYNDREYTIMNTVVHWHKRIIMVLKITLVC